MYSTCWQIINSEASFRDTIRIVPADFSMPETKMSQCLSAILKKDIFGGIAVFSIRNTLKILKIYAKIGLPELTAIYILKYTIFL
jgi:hypothetical protein